VLKVTKNTRNVWVFVYILSNIINTKLIDLVYLTAKFLNLLILQIVPIYNSDSKVWFHVNGERILQTMKSLRWMRTWEPGNH